MSSGLPEALIAQWGTGQKEETAMNLGSRQRQMLDRICENGRASDSDIYRDGVRFDLVTARALHVLGLVELETWPVGGATFDNGRYGTGWCATKKDEKEK